MIFNNFKFETVDGVPITCCCLDHALEEMGNNIKHERNRQYIAITNTESMFYAKRIKSHYEYIKNARYSFCDGIGIVIAARMEGKKIRRLNGPILLLKCCEYGLTMGWRHFFLGGRNGVAELLSKNLKEKFPGLIVCGTFCPPFRQLTPEEDNYVIQLINAAKPDILWVGLGLLKQENWIAEHIEKVDVPWLIGVGAVFDYHAGTARWAPGWVRYIGAEWLYRLCFEPRMLRRNIRSGLFLLEAIQHNLITWFITG